MLEIPLWETSVLDLNKNCQHDASRSIKPNREREFLELFENIGVLKLVWFSAKFSRSALESQVKEN